MKLFIRLVISAIIFSAATVLVAGAMTWGYVDTSSRTGFFYHWLYTGPHLTSRMLGAVNWPSMLATYFVQYMLVFALLLFAFKAVRRSCEFRNQLQQHE